MLEGLAAWVLNTYVGEYVENLNTTQLSIALLQGAVELENLPLKKNALQSLDLPLQVKSGFIGKITLQIPLRRLRSDPWIISIRNLYLVAGPFKHTQYDETNEKNSDQAKKLAMLEALEAKWQLHKAEKQEGYGSSWFSYGTSVATNILENIQLIIEDVHIRYEDDTLIPACPFAFGIVIKKLSAQSTDGDLTAKSMSNEERNTMFKIVELKDFAVYLDTNASMLGTLSHSDLADALQRDMYVNIATRQFQDHEYILAPVSAQTQVKRNTSPLPIRTSNQARIELDVTLDKLDFRLSEDQYQSIVQFLKEMELHDIRQKYRKWKPHCSVSESPAAWWNFAISANLEKIREKNTKSTWSFISKRMKDIRLYTRIYTKYLVTQDLNDKEMNQKKDLEEELAFDELKILRETVYLKVKRDGKLYKPPVEVKEPTASPEQQGILQRWFPGWGGWYGSTSPAVNENTPSAPQSVIKDFHESDQRRQEAVGEPPPKAASTEIGELDLEQEIMDVIHDTTENTSFLKKDTVFALMKFNLKSGSFQLKTSKSLMPSLASELITAQSTILELECSDIDMMFESRPRSSAMKFEMGVGGLLLRDKMTENTIFPNILSPQPKERILQFRSPSGSQNATHKTLSPTTSDSGMKDDTLFELKYEKNPANTNANYRLSIRTKPLDIVYNPTMVRRVREFFSTRKMNASKMSRLKLTEAARRQYEAFKAQTRAELQNTLEQLMDGEESLAKRWDINLDISAPQIMVPENFTDTASNMVVLDLGHLHFYSRSFVNTKDMQKSEEEDDEFQTPPSTPPVEKVTDPVRYPSPDFTKLDLTEAQLYDKLYEKYSLDLNDLQVMVGKPKDNWKHTRGRGSTHLHIVDKFSINLQFERRLIHTADPHWPSMTVSGNLPTLTLHLNEQKVLSLRTCVETLSAPTAYTVPYDMTASMSGQSLHESVSGDLSSISTTAQVQSMEHSRRMDDKIRETLEESRLIIAQFSIIYLSLEIQSRGRSLVELQVTQVKANLTKRPFDSTMSMSVHSLLVVDALQMYGQDFELLVASHKHVTIDSKSGSLLGSDPASPISATSPTSPRSPIETLPQTASVSSLQSVQDAISNAFQNLVKSASRSTVFTNASDPVLSQNETPPSVHDTEALISLELDIIGENSPSNNTGSELKVANIQFNSLDIIANQETMVELLEFLKIITPNKKSTSATSLSQMEPFNVSHDQNHVTEQQSKGRLEVTADFNRLGLLLMRIEDSKAYKVATATMSSARVQASIDKDLDVSGSLGGFHVLDVSSEDIRHQQMFGVGSDITGSHGYQNKLSSSYFPPPDVMYKTAHEESMFSEGDEEDTKAFSFHFTKGIQVSETLQDFSFHKLNKTGAYKLKDDKVLSVSVEIASMCYVHSPSLLHEITECLSEFKDYASSVALSIKTAAAEVAMGIVTKRAADTTVFGSVHNLDDSKYDLMDIDELGNDSIDEMNVSQEKESSFLSLSAKLQTPVIVIPRTPSSSEALVAHLGEITIKNVESEDVHSTSNCNKMFIEAKDMNLYSMDLDTVDQSHTEAFSQSNMYHRNQCGTPIVFDTTVEIAIMNREPEIPLINRDDHIFFGEESYQWKSQSYGENSEIRDVMEISAKIATPLKVQLCKDVYEQILQTTDNLTYDERVHKSHPTSPRVSNQEVPLIPLEKKESPQGIKPSQIKGKSQKQMTTKVLFEVPMFEVELKGDFDAGEKGLVDLKLGDFSLEFEKSNTYCTDIQIKLKSLIMEDLLANTNSDHKYLLISRDRKKESEEQKPKLFLSVSCPDNTILSPSPMMPHSLPVSFHDNLDNANLHLEQGKPLMHHPSLRKSSRPLTPPPSLRTSRRVSHDSVIEDSLVHIKVQLIDKNSPEYKEKYDRINRFIDVDFNCLDANVNLQTWVMLMDFLGMGSKIPDASAYNKMDDAAPREEGDVIRLPASEEPSVNSVVNLTVKSFVLLFNKPEYELCCANIENWSSHIKLRDGNFTISGQLGHASLMDMSPHGRLYQEKFVTAGDQALVFDIFKYGSVDPNLTRNCDISVRLQMSSIRYIHTNRFQSEFVAFLQHFLQLQDVLGRYRAASAGKKITDKATRGSRIKLDVEIQSPILLFPHSSKSTDVLVADFGNLTIQNSFCYDGEEGTLTAINAIEAKEKSQIKRQGSKESLSSMTASEVSEFSYDGSSAAFHNMTQSVFNQYNPPMNSSTHPMLQSIYGSLDSDLRSPDNVSFELESDNEIFDPTDSPTSPDGSSVDPEFFPESGSWLSISSALPSQSQLQASVRSSRSSGKLRKTPSGNSIPQLVTVGADEHRCLLDLMNIDLKEMDLYSAERIKKSSYQGNMCGDLEFKSCVIQRQSGKLLKEKCRFKLHVERNLEGDISHSAPDWKIQGALSSVYCSLDITQFKLVRGILEHNLGEKLPEFQRPLMSHLMDPVNQTVLSGKVWQGISLAIDLNNVTVELLMAHAQGPDFPDVSLAKLDFICSTLKFDTFSDQSKDIDLVSNEIVASDTRYRDAPVNVRPNVFEKILQPGSDSKKSNVFQLELHYRTTRESNKFTVLLNNMKLMCIFDWLLSVQEFITTNPDNPFIQTCQETSSESFENVSKDENSPVASSGSRTTSPVNVSSGIMTKRGPIVEEGETPFELKLNVSDTEFVVVEDSRSLDTNAVILKCTAILNFRPKAQDKLLSCSLQSVEVFSCSLLAEEETALSIIDPLTIHIDLNANPLPEPKLSSSAGLLEASQVQKRNLQLEIAFNVMNIRLSYHDMNMFLAILNSLPEQALKAANRESQKKSIFPEDKVIALQDLGFSVDDCEKALSATNMNLTEAALWLTKYGKPLPKSKCKEKKNSQEGGNTLTGMELKSSCISLCLIDDCGDSDVPLAELDFNNIQIYQKVKPVKEGRASFHLTGDFFNRGLSGWEPFLEPWRCHCEWKQYEVNGEKKTSLQVNAPDVLNLNISSSLLEQYNKTKDSWSEDYYRQKEPANSPRTNSTSSLSQSPQRRRVPFVPFMLQNQTGCTLWFTTVTTTAIKYGKIQKQIGSQDEGHIQASEWKKVAPGEIMPFVFHGKEKKRHQKTHDLRINQLSLKIDGWQKLNSISVDKVGVYFRHCDADKKQATGLAGLIYSSKHDPEKQQKSRVVIEVRQEGSAKKVITVRSALIIRNRLDSAIELKMAAGSRLEGKFNIIKISPGSNFPIPLPYINTLLYARPSDWPVRYCNEPIQWQHVGLVGQIKDKTYRCETNDSSGGVYRFCASVKRENYPEQLLTDDSCEIIPGHTITLLPPVVLHNLLPVDMRYYIKQSLIEGLIRPGKRASLHAADPQVDIELGVKLENFEECRELLVPPDTTFYKVKLRLFDEKKRLLELLVKIISRSGGCVNLYISAPFWLVNRSGLPLVFSQDSASQESAGQFEEHELARSVTPLLFSYAEKELPDLCSMRVGKSVKGSNSVPIWCTRFSLERGVGMRRLTVVPKDKNRPDWLVALQTQAKMKLSISVSKVLQVYNIGIEVKRGKGKYNETNIVTFAPLYEIDNQSSHKLAVAQRHIALGKESRIDGHLTALPKCKLPFHWPRLDLDQLLCVKLLGDTVTNWSGGFKIDKTSSFHINMRNQSGRNHLLKVEIVQQGPTFFIVFADTESLPPPFRIDNLSEVPVLYYQSQIENPAQKSWLKPHTTTSYAWDEPMLDHFITLKVQSGTEASYNMDQLGEGTQLCYSNLIYLVATSTFSRNTVEDRQNLVLEVVESHYVKFMPKEIGNRNQLWRMTSQGLLEHEGTMAPRDPHRSSSTSRSLVLDINDIAPQPEKIVPLTLRKRDDRRKSTQTWKFTEDGCLCCRDGVLCVQVLGGEECLRAQSVAVLGPCNKGETIPSHMKISRQRHMPGSGCLTVRTTMDGPIRLLQITDISQRQIVRQVVSKKYEDWEVYDEKIKSSEESSLNEKSSLELNMSLKGGFGISLINKTPQELVYITLGNIQVDYISHPTSVTMDISVGSLQVDNQLFNIQRPVMLFITPVSKRDGPDNTPALHVAAQRVPNAEWNSEIFKHFIVSMKKLSIQLEEQLLWKLLQFIGMGQDQNIQEEVSSEDDPRKSLVAATSVQSKRYYFGVLKINTSRITLSMLTASKLSPDLKAIKQSMSIPLVKFEDAKVDLDPFIKHHPFETQAFLQKEIVLHYTEELKSQAAKILGSVDFLGNPLGLFNDVTEGISGLIKDGNVGGLLKNVTHGVSNSAAKMASSLSDTLGNLNMDNIHNERRETIRNSGQSSSGHLVAGVKGFGVGLFGALTSIVSQPVQGYKEEGVEGFLMGIGKGVVGTVTKPVAGVLDLASGAANAIKDTSTSSSKISPPRVRKPRCCYGPGRLLPAYSSAQAKSQELLHKLNRNKHEEYFIALEQLRSGKEDSLLAMITSEQVYFMRRGAHNPDNVILQIRYLDLKLCFVVESDQRYYIELVLSDKSSKDQRKRPQVRCDKEYVAHRVAQQINYAYNLYDELKHTLSDSGVREDISMYIPD